MGDVNRVTISINGTRYPITAKDDPAYVQSLALELDKSVRYIVERNSNISQNEILVLLCISYLDEYKKEKETADNLRGQLAEYLEDAAKARLEAGEAKRQVSRLERKLEDRKGITV